MDNRSKVLLAARLLITWVAAILIGSAPAYAQNGEIAGSLSALLGGDRTAADATKFSLDADYALGLTYEHRIKQAGPFALYGGIDFVASQLRGVNSTNRTLTRDLATIYLTPNVMLKFISLPRLTPWIAVGAGVSIYEQSNLQIDGQRNPASRDVTHAAFTYGGGVDIPVWGSFALRGQIKDYYSGSPSYNIPVSGGQHNLLVGAAIVYRWGR